MVLARELVLVGEDLVTRPNTPNSKAVSGDKTSTLAAVRVVDPVAI